MFGLKEKGFSTFVLIKKKIETSEIHIVPDQPVPIRLQEYGVGIFEAAMTKSAFKKILKKGHVTVDDCMGSSATFIYGGETIRCTFAPVLKPTKELVLSLKILYEDDYLAIVHKPAGILVSGNRFRTVTQALPQNLKKSPLSDATKPQPVHRLDYPTTGALLVGKTKSSIRLLNKLFENKAIHKTYYAVTIGEMSKIGEITTEIDGKKAHSDFRRLQSVVSKRFGCLNLVVLNPKSGRRHQLRKHLYSIGNPILGDREYCIESLVLKGKGLYLHAHSLEFMHPFNSEKLHVVDVLPKRFTTLFPPL